MPDENGKWTKDEQAELCRQGIHYYAPARGIDGLRWCYHCGATVDPDEFFGEAIRGLVDKFRKKPY